MRTLTGVGLLAAGIVIGVTMSLAVRTVRLEAAGGTQTAPTPLALRTAHVATVGASQYAAVTDGKGCWLVITNGTAVAAVAQAPPTSCQ